MTELITATSPAQLLAVVPALVGLEPTDSLVVVGFRGRRTFAAYRYPLPRPSRTGERDALVAAAVGTACRIPDLDAVALVCYSPRRFGGRAMPDRATAQAAAVAFERAGFRVLDSFVVVADGWGAIDDPDLPAGGRPRAELESGARTPNSDADMRVPARDPQAAARLAGRLRTIERDPERVRDVDPVGVLEELLRGADPRASAADAAALVALLGIPSIRDALLLQCAFGGAAAEESLAADERFRREAAARGLSFDELTAEHLDAGVPSAQTALLLGRSTAPPESERVRLAMRVVGTLVADAPRRYRPPLLTMLGWLAWALGRGSAAGAHLDRALSIDPHAGLARLLQTWIGSGAMPEWVFGTLPRAE
ncbi:DUF4192 family protein [Agromyces seonyuensis]|uniref:DUF4192 family protein n=1 Tax=Agromyces seonyuensis TaxID=2662446 RepID=A0A6I4NY34_9MICO|nr:DUF4192 family protein [Agromyces seonyuensis]MWB99280.1 DUF4192 family protein [Agromyces seonyuensis]